VQDSYPVHRVIFPFTAPSWRSEDTTRRHLQIEFSAYRQLNYKACPDSHKWVVVAPTQLPFQVGTEAGLGSQKFAHSANDVWELAFEHCGGADKEVRQVTREYRQIGLG
jgi:hypothetical protein